MLLPGYILKLLRAQAISKRTISIALRIFICCK
jgi:hypothetical protein